jgi:hypothetical protein
MQSQLVPFDVVANYKHPHLVARLQRKCSMSHEEAEQLFLDTKQFMYLCAKYPGGLAPTKVIDEGWHNFILFTRDYRRFCLDFLGRFIHHEPIPPGTAKNGELVRKAVNLARSTFGDSLSKNWSAEGADCDKCAPAPSCDASRSPSYNPL